LELRLRSFLKSSALSLRMQATAYSLGLSAPGSVDATGQAHEVGDS